MALDLSPERYGSQALPQGAELTGEEIMKEADRIAEARKYSKIIAEEIINELDKREESKENTISESLAETNPTENTTAAVIEIQGAEYINYTLPIISACCGFLMGILVAWLFFRTKINRIRKECEAKGRCHWPDF